MNPPVTLSNGLVRFNLSSIVNLSSNLSLSSILHILKFTFYLMFVSKLTRTLNCNITFFLKYCLFQDLVMNFVRGMSQMASISLIQEHHTKCQFQHCNCL